MKIIKHILLIVLIFLYIYYPPICKFNLLYLIGFLAWIYILVVKAKDFYKFISKKFMFIMYVSLVVACFYISVVCILNNNSILSSSIVSLLFWMFINIPVCYVITNIMIRKNFSTENMLEILCQVASIQGVFSIISFFNSSFHQWYLNKMINYGFQEERFTLLARYRIYGMAMHLTNFAPLVSAILVVMAVFCVGKKKKYVIYILLMLFSIIVNSRSPLVFVIVGVIALLFYYVADTEKFLQYILYMASALALGYLLVDFVKNTNEEFANWINTGIREILDFLLHRDYSTGYFSYLLDPKNYRLPSGIWKMLFGQGTYSVGIVATDVGYINYIWMGGVFYLIFVFGFMFFLTKYLKRSKDEILRFTYFLIVLES